MTTGPSDIVRIDQADGIATITIDHPPVNALSHAVRVGLDEALTGVLADPATRAIVILCAGNTFFAGADIAEFGKPVASPDLLQLIARLEDAPVPVIAAIHGTALGGGFELALVCHYRVAVASARVGLPEVRLGFPPGAGGTQRVPRLIGAARALDLLTSGKPMPAPEAAALGLLDAIAPEDDLKAFAIGFAQSVIAAGSARPRIRDRTDWIDRDRATPGLFDDFRTANARLFRGYKAPGAIVEAIEAAVHLPFAEGLAREQALFQALAASPESAAQRHIFFAEREAGRVPGLLPSSAAAVDRVAVLGAGTMGAGIAIACLDSGLHVTLIDATESGLDRGRRIVDDTYRRAVAKGQVTTAVAEARRDALTVSLDLAAVEPADLVIEAVFEEMALKQDIFRQLDAAARPGALLASNTSFLDIDEIAGVTSRPEAVLGLHFFSPANVMRLLEIVRGARTSDAAIATAFRLARRLGKLGVLSGVCDGFIVNRLMRPRALAADAMALEGTPIAAIDAALVGYGFAIGHFQMMDMVGLDVIGRGQAERTVLGDLVAAGRLGQKSGHGYYDYDERRRPTPSAAVDAVIARLAAAHGVARKPPPTADEILDRLLLPVVREGERILAEGIALRASDIDVAAVAGYNWPPYTGGPMYWGPIRRRPGMTSAPRPIVNYVAPAPQSDAE